MTPEQIKKVVEDFARKCEMTEKLQKRLINLSGRDPEQEMVILQRLAFLESSLDLIDCAIYDGKILSDRESTAVMYRTQGETLETIGELFSLKSREGVRKILVKAYEKMADAAKEQNIGR